MKTKSLNLIFLASLISSFVCFFTLDGFSLLKAKAITFQSTPHWVQMSPKDFYSYYYYSADIPASYDPFVPPGCSSGGEAADYGEGGGWACSSLYLNPFNAWSTFMTNYSTYYYSNGDSAPLEASLTKPVPCPNGEAMTGIRFFQIPVGVDDEHVDAYCVSIPGINTSSAHWIKPTNAMNKLYGSYKSAVCPLNEIMIGVEMWGAATDMDDEHVNSLCAPLLPGVNIMSYGGHWVQAPNAFNNISGYKEAICPAGEIMNGARIYMAYSEVDDEHVDVYCSLVTVATPTVNIKFQN